ncbi:MAG TPA: hypothetical protein VGS16_15940 [Candidatus Dormibacteraeota bacterium]|nr:hypothetical protein [Candidatus Dormibacteraeota bacterium]
MSEPEDLELEALQRQLDDAFDTARPRVGFEDELWTRMQARRPAGSRLRDAWLGLIEGIREAPRVPMAAAAAVLVVIIGVSALAYSGARFGGGAGSTASLSSGAQHYDAGSPGTFGRLPSPVLIAGAPTKAVDGASQPGATAPSAAYAGPVTLTWTGKLDLRITTAPVFRYREPSTNTADQFATSLGAILQNRPAGYLGSYETTDFNVRVRGTVQAPAHEPSFIILPITALAPIEAAGGPVDVAVVFLAQHSLAPSWPYTSDTVVLGDLSKVTLSRQFAVGGYGYAYLVDGGGERYGLEVDLNGNKPTSAMGPLPLNLESADYSIISADEAVRSALASSPASAGSANTPTVALTTAELVYSMVVAGDHSFYEPSILFTGSFKVNGTTYVKHVLVPAVDPSQRSS